MPQVSLIQEQRDLFHRLQQIIEADRNARATVEAKRKEAEAHRKEEERVADDELRRATSSLNEAWGGFGCTASVVGLIALIFLILVLTNVVQFLTTGQTVLGIIALAVIFILVVVRLFSRKESLKRQH